MKVTGEFEVDLQPQIEDSIAAGRMLISKRYTGGLSGQAVGQMISVRTEGGESVYSAIESFEGELAGRAGGFTLFHVGRMSAEGQSLDVRVVEGSGTGGLQGLLGTMTIIIEGGEHRYEFDAELPEG